VVRAVEMIVMTARRVAVMTVRRVAVMTVRRVAVMTVVVTIDHDAPRLVRLTRSAVRMKLSVERAVGSMKQVRCRRLIVMSSVG
jgi:hypothetical protein